MFKTRTFEGHTNAVSCVAVLPDGKFVSGSLDQTLRVWDRNQPTSENYSRKRATLQELRTLPPMSIFPGGIEFQEAEQRFQNAQNIRAMKRSRKHLTKRRKTRKYARRSRSNK